MPFRNHEILCALGGIVVGVTATAVALAHTPQGSRAECLWLRLRGKSSAKGKEDKHLAANHKTTSTSTLVAEDERVIYEVNVDIVRSLADKYGRWLEGHIKDLLKLPGFQSATWFRRDEGTKPLVVFVLGGPGISVWQDRRLIVNPGSGKGTQCTRIVKEFGFTHISAGDCLREAKESGSSDGELINQDHLFRVFVISLANPASIIEDLLGQALAISPTNLFSSYKCLLMRSQYIKEGKIVPVEITVNLLKKAMAKSGNDAFLIDGFPRNLNNLDGWKSVMGDSAEVAFVLFLDCPENVMEKRLLDRGKTSGRVDDNVESIRKRFNTYINDTMPIINQFDKEKKVKKVDSTVSVDEVYKQIKPHFVELRKTLDERKQHHTIAYILENKAALESYLTKDAPRMRQSMTSEFPDPKSVIATRRILTQGKLYLAK